MTRQRPIVAVLLAAIVLLVASIAAAAEWSPPPLTSHVVDEAHALDAQQALQLDQKLERARRANGFAIVVYLLPKLPDGLSIEDVSYKAFNAWGVGSAKGDDGILVLASLEEHKLRIETGKGAGGALTDIASSEIDREVIGPLMKQGQVYEAMDRGTDAIEQEITKQQAEGSDPGKDPAHARRQRSGSHENGVRQAPGGIGRFLVYGLILLGVIVLSIVSPTFRSLLFFWLLSGGGRGGGGGG